MKKLCVFLASVVFVGINFLQAQNVQITGTVTSAEDGEPLIGATIQAKGTGIGVATDFDGKYSISVPASATVLEFRSIGMKSQDVEIAGRTVINVVLEPDVTMLDEIVVTAYGTATKQSFTGSAATVSAEKIEKQQVSNISKSLAGAVAGVQVLSANGQPGTEATIRIRGVGSINAGSNPLYVVDGVPFDGDLSSLNPSDIESMTVLKDAASTALYGARGANGIIMITTKKGSSVKSHITFDMRLGQNSRAITNYDVIDSPEAYYERVYQTLWNEGFYDLGYDEGRAHMYANARYYDGSEASVEYQTFTLPEGEKDLVLLDGTFNPAAIPGYVDGAYYFLSDNWANETFQKNLRQEYNLTMSGGDARQTYYLSFNNLNDLGIIPGSGFTRYSGRFRGDSQIKDWLKVGANVNYNRTISEYPGDQTNATSSANAFFASNYIAPIYPLYVRDAETKEIMEIAGRNVYDYGDKQSTHKSRPFMSKSNPLGDLTFNRRHYKMDILHSNWFAEIKPMDGLTLTARYGVSVDNTHFHRLGNVYMGQSSAYGGTVTQEGSRSVGLNQQYLAYYDKRLNDISRIDVTLGYDGYSYSGSNVYATGRQLYNPESYFVSNAISDLTGGGSAFTYVTKGFFGRVNYSVLEKYFANASYRRDASSRFAPENRWGNFYAFSAAWLMSKEEFMSDIDWIDMLKLKASYGEQGNDNIGNYYAYLDQYSILGVGGLFSDATLSYKGNRDLTWETSVTYNVGVDYSFLRGAISGSLEYFGRNSRDMLYYKPVPVSLGYSSIPMNVGSMQNTGLEFDFLGYFLRTNNLNMAFNLNATMVKNKILKLHEDLDGELRSGSRILTEGESMYRYYMVEWAGVNPENGHAMYWAVDEEGDRFKTEDYSFAEEHKIATEDLLPKVYGGFGLSFDFYGFDASVQLSYQLGGKIYDSGYARLMHGGGGGSTGNNWHKDIYNAWTADNTDTDVPILNPVNKYTNSYSTRFLVSSDYLSLNNITVGYTLPANLTNQMKIATMRIYFAADNIGFIAARKGLDPRQSFLEATTAIYTPIRTVSGGLLITF